MRNLFTSLALLAAFTVNANPDRYGGKSLEDHPENRVQYFADRLQLTDDQAIWFRTAQARHLATVDSIRASYEPILQEQARDLSEVRRNFPDDPEGGGTASEAVRREFRTRLDPMYVAIEQERLLFMESLSAQLTEQQLAAYKLLGIEVSGNSPLNRPLVALFNA